MTSRTSITLPLLAFSALCSVARAEGNSLSTKSAYFVTPAQTALFSSNQVEGELGYSRWVWKIKEDGKDVGGVAYKQTALGVSPYARVPNSPVVVGLPIGYAIDKANSLSDDGSSEDRTTITTFTPTVATRIGPAAVGFAYENIREAGNWRGANYKQKDYALSAWRSHLGALLTLGSGEIGVGYSNRIDLLEEKTDTAATASGTTSSSSDVTLLRYPRTTLHARFPLNSKLSVGGVLDYTPLNDNDKEGLKGEEKKVSNEELIGLKGILFASLAPSLDLETTLHFSMPGRYDLNEGTGLTTAYGLSTLVTCAHIKSFAFSGLLSWMQGTHKEKNAFPTYDDNGNVVATNESKFEFKTQRAEYGLAARYFF